ncbi:hypothetical protein GCM10007298_14920 [Williamsia phyllosphaerae]|uniref:Uncharacterized protein n=1 Tax=Williamsia phyllosphaerae TaxID=885042 RepID=A0ABQ1UK01_9NOCA|nr:hypothetical protein GCM10007298_14920 [Williamsia phyllosphaerae]
MTLSGQVRSGTEMVSTSSANERYRCDGIAEFRWVFQEGCSEGMGPVGSTMRLTPEVKLSAAGISGHFSMMWTKDRRMIDPRDGKPV